MTYIRLGARFIYLAVVMDYYSRRIVGWELGEQPTAALCLTALRQALRNRQPGPGLLHHSDQGVQYASTVYQAELAAHGVVGSMARRGDPYENARMESWMSTLKEEEVHRVEYRDFPEARTRIGHYIEEFYNRERLHSALGYQSPMSFEAHYGKTHS